MEAPAKQNSVRFDVSSIVLAGGRGKRYGGAKCWESLDDKTLIERVVERLAPWSKEVLVVASAEQTEKFERGRLATKVVADIFPGKGSMGGIYTGLMAASTRYNVVVACDMPFLKSDLLRYMVEVVDGCDVVVPRLGPYYEPLHAVYSRDCAVAMEGLLGLGILSVTSVFKKVKVRYVEEKEINRFDAEHLSFFNINTVEDMAKARLLLSESSSGCTKATVAQ